MASLFNRHSDYTSIKDGPSKSGVDDSFNLDSHPTHEELSSYVQQLTPTELVQAVEARLTIGQRCIDIGQRILESDAQSAVTPAQLSAPRTDSAQLDASLNDAVHNAREAAGEVKLMINRLGQLLGTHPDPTLSHKRQSLQQQHSALQQSINTLYQQTQQRREQQQQKQSDDVRIDIGTEQQRSAQISSKVTDSGRQRSKRERRQHRGRQSQQAAVTETPDYDAYQQEDREKEEASTASPQFQVLEEWSPEQQAELDDELRARHEFVKQIERDVIQVHEMFRDLNSMVSMQQYMVDSIEASIMETADKTKRGMEQIFTAEQYQRKKRAKMCCLVLAIALIILTFITTLSVILR